jgi:hypothetical protein
MIGLPQRDATVQNCNDRLVSISSREFLEQLNDCKLLKKDFANWSALAGGSQLLSVALLEMGDFVIQIQTLLTWQRHQ